MSSDTQQLELVHCRRCGRVGPRFTPIQRCPDDGWVMIEQAIHHAFPKDTLLGRPLMGGKYLLVDRLGRGGFGSVYRAIQHPVGREVAVKVIKERDTDEGLRARFFREARIIGQLNHDATVSLYDYGEEDGVLFMVLELIRGDALKDVLEREGGRLSPARAVNILRQTLEALAEAHHIGLIHRDLKPGNIMISQSPFGGEKVKVLDFGIAKVLDNTAAEDAENQTREGLVVGTPRYMAPEQARGVPEARSDLYSAGVLLFQMLLGFRPFDGASTYDILKAHNEAPVPPIPPEIPHGLAQVIHTALQKRPEHRYHSAAEMATALIMAQPQTGGDRVMGPPPPHAHPIHSQDSTSTEMLGERYGAPRASSNTLLFVLSGALVLIASVAFFLWFTQIPKRPHVAQVTTPLSLARAPDASPVEARPVDPFIGAVVAANRGDVDEIIRQLSEAMIRADDLSAFRARVEAEQAFSAYQAEPRLKGFFPLPKPSAPPPPVSRPRKRAGPAKAPIKAPTKPRDKKPPPPKPPEPTEPTEEEGFKVNRL
ncbi:serine/threonine protein kinase [Myxococcota bacterium]|nr:serine/threonine protein kinase [Myxococcota bacterium]MBU1896817.1 serine/threonine protein kinase [Myxococcota bacterium]